MTSDALCGTLSPHGYEFRVFPPTQNVELAPGDWVFVNLRSEKQTGRAQVTGEPAGDRCPVAYACGGEAHVRLGRLTKDYSASRLVLICGDTASYRRLCRTQVFSGDAAIDIGSSYGVSTKVLWEQCGNAVGIEVSRKLHAEACAQHPGIRFERFDCLAEKHNLLEIAQEIGCNKVFIDIGGNRELAALVEIVPWVAAHLKPGLIVVKSEQLLKSIIEHLREVERRHAPDAASSADHGGDGAAPCGAPPVPEGCGQRWFNATRLGTHISGTPAGLPRAWSPGPEGAAFCRDGLPVVLNCDEWWAALEEQTAAQLEKAEAQSGKMHPLDHMIRTAPNGVRICRFHNYSVCLKGSSCPHDHTHCHRCQKPGHLAHDCGGEQ